MSRLPDWEARLSRFITANRNRPFQWGEWDCALYATACAAELTGIDRAAEFRGTYQDRIGSARALRELGKGTLVATMDSLFERKSPSRAGRGDLIGAQGAVGVCMGGYGLFVGEEGSRAGLVKIERRHWTIAWGV